MAELYGYRIDDYINGLPDGDEYKTLFTTMDKNNNDFKLIADDVKRLEIIAKPICNATE